MIEVMESGEFIDESTNGRLDGIYLLGWTGDYPHPTNFLDFHFAAQQSAVRRSRIRRFTNRWKQASQIAIPEDTLPSTLKRTTPSRNWCPWSPLSIPRPPTRRAPACLA